MKRTIALLLALASLAGCGGPLTAYNRDGQTAFRVCVKSCDLKQGRMICEDHSGRPFEPLAVPGIASAQFDTQWTPFSCRCHFHFSDVKE